MSTTHSFSCADVTPVPNNTETVAAHSAAGDALNVPEIGHPGHVSLTIVVTELNDSTIHDGNSTNAFKPIRLK